MAISFPWRSFRKERPVLRVQLKLKSSLFPGKLRELKQDKTGKCRESLLMPGISKTENYFAGVSLVKPNPSCLLSHKVELNEKVLKQKLVVPLLSLPVS